MCSTDEIVVTIDGPAGAGKSSVARQLASKLGFDFLDTGAFYRAVTLAVLRARVDPRDESAVADLTASLKIDQRPGGEVFVDGDDVTGEIRLPEVTRAIGPIADNVAVRRLLTEQQRISARGRRVVTEGRDQGTEAFPDAACKIFLTASREERARRRHQELTAKGQQIAFEEVLADQDLRDEQDASRPVGALRIADDAIEVTTDGMEMSAVVDQLATLVAERISPQHQSNDAS